MQSGDVLREAPGKTPKAFRELILKRGRSWFDEHPEDRQIIAENAEAFGFSPSDEMLTSIEENISLHYFEKLVPLCGDPAFLAEFVRSNVNAENAVKSVGTKLEEGKGVLLATPHFGAVELLTPTLSLQRIPMSAVLRFTTQELSERVHAHAEKLTEGGLFAPIRFIELGKPGTSAGMEMAAVIRRKEVLLTVFDEKTNYSIPVSLFGKKLWGGAGLDRLVKFSSAPIAVFAAFMVRTEKEFGYELRLAEIAPDGNNLIQNMYDALQDILRDHFEQWYFLHEQIPFVEENGE
jgi:lauroyl/myristoyl acyltransferase